MSRSSSRTPGASISMNTAGNGPPRSGRHTKVSIAPDLVAMWRVCSIMVSVQCVLLLGRCPDMASSLTCALDGKGAGSRIVEPARQDFLVFRRIVPALEPRGVGEFDDDNTFRLRPTFDQFGLAAADQKATPILLDSRADRRPVGLHPGLIGDLQFDDDISR